MTEKDLSLEEILAIYSEFEKFSGDDDLPKKFWNHKGEIEYVLGEIYERGTHGVERDFAKAAEYFRKAQSYNFAAKKILAEKYFDGRGVAKDDSLALEMFLEVAGATEDVESLKNAIAILKTFNAEKYYFRQVTEFLDSTIEITSPEFLKVFSELQELKNQIEEYRKVKTEEREKFLKAAENGDIDSLEKLINGSVQGYNLATRHYCPKLIREGNIEAMRLLGDANNFNADAIYWYKKYLEKATDAEKIRQVKSSLAYAYFFQKDYDNAFKLYQELLSVEEHPEYLEKLATMYENGWGVAQDLHKAETLYTKLAEQGNRAWTGIDNLLRMYLKYESLTPDFDKVLRLYEKNNCFVELGDMYYNGWGVEVSFQRAFQYYEKALQNRRSCHVMRKIIPMLLKGEGVRKDEDRAFELIREIGYDGGEETIKYCVIRAYREIANTYSTEEIAANDAYINITLAAAHFGNRNAGDTVGNVGWFLYKNGDKVKGLKLLDTAIENGYEKSFFSIF